jgi:hypothetical protein
MAILNKIIEPIFMPLQQMLLPDQGLMALIDVGLRIGVV